MSGQPEQQLAGQTVVDDNTSLLDETEYNRQTSSVAPAAPPAPASAARAAPQPVSAPAQPALAQRAPPPVSATAMRAQAMQGRIENRAQKSVSSKLSKIGQYKATGISVEYSETKVGVMPDVIGTIQEIADSAGVNTGNPEEFSPFIEALVADIYTNAYSDKQTFTGKICVGDYELERRHIKLAIEPKVGTMHRRFAKAMAPMVVDVLKNSIHTTGSFNELLDRRIMETNVSTREEAASEFDGNDGLVNLDRKSAQRAAERKFLALAKRSDESEKSYYVGNSADAIASSSKGGVEAPRNVV